MHDRATLVPGYQQPAVRKCVVNLIGAGGINGSVGEILVRKGVSRLNIFDPDVVELSNLNRQHFYWDDLDKLKAFALTQNLAREATEETLLCGYPRKFEEAVRQAKDVPCTVAVCGVDNDASRLFCTRYFFQRQIPCLFIAVSRDASCGYVFVQTSQPGQPCWRCLYPDAGQSQGGQRCPAGATPDILRVVAGIATYALDSLIMDRPRVWNYKEVFLAGGVADGHRIIAPNPECPVCGQKPTGSHT